MNKMEIVKNVENKVKKELEGKMDSSMLGYIHIFEKRKKEILEKEYGIIFNTARENNKSCNID